MGGFGANKENSNYSWTMMILNKLPGAQKRKNKKNKKGSGSADGRPGNGNIVRNEFLFPAERSKGSYSHRPDSVVEEEITLKTLKRLVRGVFRSARNKFLLIYMFEGKLSDNGTCLV